MNAYNLQQIVDIPTIVSINKGTPTDDTFLDQSINHLFPILYLQVLRKPKDLEIVIQSIQGVTGGKDQTSGGCSLC